MSSILILFILLIYYSMAKVSPSPFVSDSCVGSLTTLHFSVITFTNAWVCFLLQSDTAPGGGSLIPTVTLSPATLSWQTVAHTGLLSLPQTLQDKLLSLMEKHLPVLLQFFSPLLTSQTQQRRESSEGERDREVLTQQGEVYSAVQLVGTLCQVLKVRILDLDDPYLLLYSTTTKIFPNFVN